MVYKVKTPAEFKAFVDDEKLTVVDFFADWCGPCKAISPTFVELSVQFEDAQFIKVDVDQENMETIVAECHITAMPTFLFFKNGLKIAEMKGADKIKLKELVEKHH